ncbi:hypothetical protein PAPHI01_1196 [Pancytospora philotis]|nr:hypothetical protein PAPHI01_1196 [Pancytospora philotis]
MRPVILFGELLQLASCASAASESVNRKRKLEPCTGLKYRWDCTIFDLLLESCRSINASLGRFKSVFAEDCRVRITGCLHQITGSDPSVPAMGREGNVASALFGNKSAVVDAPYSNLEQRKEILAELEKFLKFFAALRAQGQFFDMNNPISWHRYKIPRWLATANAQKGESLSWWDPVLKAARLEFNRTITRCFKKMYDEALATELDSGQESKHRFTMPASYNIINKHYLHDFILRLAHLFFDYVEFIANLHEKRGSVLNPCILYLLDYKRHAIRMPSEGVLMDHIGKCASELFTEQEAAFAAFLNDVEQKRDEHRARAEEAASASEPVPKKTVSTE